MTRPAAALLGLALIACAGADRQPDAAADLRAEMPGEPGADSARDVPADTPADAPAGHDSPADAGPDVSASFCPALGIDCNPFLCRNGTCLSSCDSDADCVAPATCQSGSCRGPPVDSCTRAEHCASGFCQQGVCCDRACRSPCESCALPASRGKCRPLPASQQPDAGCAEDAGAD